MISIKACMWRQIEDAKYEITSDGLSEHKWLITQIQTSFTIVKEFILKSKFQQNS